MNYTRSYTPTELLLGLVNLGRYECAASVVRVVQKHQLPVCSLNLCLLCGLSDAEDESGLPSRHWLLEGALVRTAQLIGGATEGLLQLCHPVKADKGLPDHGGQDQAASQEYQNTLYQEQVS